ncbi:MAG: ADP-forming succinate--CoA ligase subunit beta [Acidobacteriota bacterium]
MKIHEYQAKEILTRYGVRIPEGKVAKTPLEAYEIARQMGRTVAVKAQIHAGGRGKGGGIRIAKTPAEVRECAGKLIGSKLVTPQTGPEGKEVQCVLIEEGLDIHKEFYLGIIIDRSQQKPVFMASREGGVEIEEVARKSPKLILKEYIHPAVGLQSFQARRISFGLGLDAGIVSKASGLMMALYRAFELTDASLAEINPLVLTGEGELYALDAKMNLDDNALYRHPEIVEMRDLLEEEPLEIEASRYRLNYIKLDGEVGCMVNGAGLAMATMDIIKLAGGDPANFLDVGGGASVEQVRNAFKILISDQKVKAVLINIFGGIMRCDVVAEGVVQAAKDIGVNVPVVVRLEGTNVGKGREILKNSGLDFEVATDMADAATKVCARAAQAV